MISPVIAVRIGSQPTSDILDRMSRLMAKDLGIEASSVRYRGPNSMLLMPLSQSRAEAMWLTPTDGWLIVSLTHPYFGVGYTHGPMLLFEAIIRWLWREFPGAEVWYGPEKSSGTGVGSYPRNRTSRPIPGAVGTAASRSQSW